MTKPDKFWEEILDMTQSSGWKNFTDDMRIRRDTLVANAINVTDMNILSQCRGNVEVLDYIINLEEAARLTIDQLAEQAKDE